MPAQPFYLLSFSALFSGRVVSSNILAMLPMTSSQVHLWSIGLWMLIGVLIISPTAGGGGLGRLRCNVDSEGGKYTSASPRCTCLPPRQHCVEVALGGKQVHLGFASEYLLSSSCNFNSSPPRPSPSSPRLRLGELGLGLGGLERSQWVGTSCNFSSSPPRQVQVHLGCASVNLALTRGT